jgi:hypothetical protein
VIARIRYIHHVGERTIEGDIGAEPTANIRERFYEQGRLVREELRTNERVDQVTTYFYDEDGRVSWLEIDSDVDGERDELTLYTYSDDGRLASVRLGVTPADDEGILGEYLDWDENGNPTERRFPESGQSNTFEYDDDCNLIRSVTDFADSDTVLIVDVDYSCWTGLTAE